MKFTFLLLCFSYSIGFSQVQPPPNGHACNPPPGSGFSITPSFLTPGGVNEIQDLITNATTAVKFSPIKYERGGDVKFNQKIKFYEKCCGGVVTQVRDKEVSGVVPFGKISGSAQFPLGPTGFVAYAKGSVALRITGTGTLQGNCARSAPDNLCVALSTSISGTLEIGIAILNPDLASLNGQLNATGSGTAEWCTEEGVKDKQVCLEVQISVELNSVFGDMTLFDNDGKPLYRECL